MPGDTWSVCYLKPTQYPGFCTSFVFITRIFSGIGNTVVYSA